MGEGLTHPHLSPKLPWRSFPRTFTAHQRPAASWLKITALALSPREGHFLAGKCVQNHSLREVDTLCFQHSGQDHRCVLCSPLQGICFPPTAHPTAFSSSSPLEVEGGHGNFPHKASLAESDGPALQPTRPRPLQALS